MTKKIFFASNKTLVPYSEGGGEVIAFDLLEALHHRGDCTVKSLGSFNYLKVQGLSQALKKISVDFHLEQQPAQVETPEGPVAYPSYAHAIYKMPNSFLTTLAREDHFAVSYEQYLQQFRPDLLLLQSESAASCYALAKSININTLYYVQNAYEMRSFIESGIQPPPLIVNSEFMKYKLEKTYQLKSEVLYPAILPDRYQSPTPKTTSDRFRFLFINPVHEKGLGIILKLAETFKDAHFTIVEGWNPPSPLLLEKFNQIGNIEFIKKTWDLTPHYANADLLLVPSQWDEAFGRVVVEAHIAGLPTLASHVGGLPEASGEAGLLIEDYKNPDAWLQKVGEILSQPSQLDAQKGNMAENAQRFSPQLAGERLLELAQLN